MMKKILLLLGILRFFSAFSEEKGTLCLTFDDRFFSSWERALPFFKKHNARVTFFVSGKIDKRAVESMKKLQEAGHSVGLHALNHAKAVDCLKTRGRGAYIRREIMPQLEICRKYGIRVRAFAYPFSQRTAETDAELFEIFDLLRSSYFELIKPGISLAEMDPCFVKKIAGKQLFYGFPTSGDFDLAEVKKAMKRASEENAVLVFYAHNITKRIPVSHHIAYSQLKKILEYAAHLGMSVCGMNEL